MDTSVSIKIIGIKRHGPTLSRLGVFLAETVERCYTDYCTVVPNYYASVLCD